tara:strand:+ start:953 stop:1114 length:162 start_codon:yes stop_codon:yes gene_type:complete
MAISRLIQAKYEIQTSISKSRIKVCEEVKVKIYFDQSKAAFVEKSLVINRWKH